MRRKPTLAILLTTAMLSGVGIPPASADSPLPYPGDPKDVYAPLMIGDTDATKAGNVSIWQTAIGMEPTGIFDPATQEKTRQWQFANGLLASGWVGPLDWDAMFGQASAQSDILFTGAGWGHGVGLSQYGTLGMANDGWSARQIIEHFYSGATPTPISQVLPSDHWLLTKEKPIWVNVVSKLVSFVYLKSANTNNVQMVICQNGYTGMATLSKGAENDYVLGLEYRLAELGFFRGTPDRVFDDETEAAVRAFQTDRNIGVDGKVGPQTRRYLVDDAGENCLLRTELTPSAQVKFSEVSNTTSFSNALDHDRIDTNRCRVSSASVDGSCRASVRVVVPAEGENPATTAPLSENSVLEIGAGTEGTGPFSYGVFARGFIRLRPDGLGNTHIVAQMGLDEYIYGIAEISNSWHLEAQKAQAIAARSYGAATARNLGTQDQLSKDKLQSCWCHLLDSTADQVYNGWAKESSSPNWVAGAQATGGLVVRYPQDGALVKTFFSSSTGGRTQNSEDRWGGVFPYYKSVDDVWSLTPKTHSKDYGPNAWGQYPNPNAVWVYSKTVEDYWVGDDRIPGARSILNGYFEDKGLPGISVLESIHSTERYDSGAVKTVTVTGFNTSGDSYTWTIDGAVFTGLMDLKGRYFTVAWPGPNPGSSPPVPDVCPVGGVCDTVMFRNSSGLFRLWETLSFPRVESVFYYGKAGDVAFSGDWDGDGVDTPGLYRQSDGYVYLRNSNDGGWADFDYFFGRAGDVPVAGDFDGDGFDTVSVYRPSEGKFFIMNELGGGWAETEFVFGRPGDVPFVGDFDGDGYDTIGLHRPTTGFVYFRNELSEGWADTDFFYGKPGDRLTAGDWDGNGTDTVAVYRPSTGMLYIKLTNEEGWADVEIKAGDFTSLMTVQNPPSQS